MAFSTNICPIKSDLSGNTVSPQASNYLKFAKMGHFLPFLIKFRQLAMLNDTFSVIFKHRVRAKNTKKIRFHSLQLFMNSGGDIYFQLKSAILCVF